MVDVESSSYLEWDGMQEKDKFLITQANIDPDFIPVLGLQLINGNNFQLQKTDDTSNYIVNESTVGRMGLTVNNIIGRKVKFWGTPGTIIGVVKDFHFQSLEKNNSTFYIQVPAPEPVFRTLCKNSAWPNR